MFMSRPDRSARRSDPTENSPFVSGLAPKPGATVRWDYTLDPDKFPVHAIDFPNPWG